MVVRDLVKTPGSKHVVPLKHYRSVDQIKDIRWLDELDKLNITDGFNKAKYDGKKMVINASDDISD